MYPKAGSDGFHVPPLKFLSLYRVRLMAHNELGSLLLLMQYVRQHWYSSTGSYASNTYFFFCVACAVKYRRLLGALVQRQFF